MLAQARALLTSMPEGKTAYLAGDVRDPASILASAEVRDTLDLSRPVALSIIAVLQFVTDDEQVHQIIDTLLAPLAPGSALALSVVTANSAAAVAASEQYTARGIPAKARTDAEVLALFRGLALVEPGVTLVHRWRPDSEPAPADDENVQMNGGVAIKA